MADGSGDVDMTRGGTTSTTSTTTAAAPAAAAPAGNTKAQPTVWDDIIANLTLLNRAVNDKDRTASARVVRKTTSIRRRVQAADLRRLLAAVWPSGHAATRQLLDAVQANAEDVDMTSVGNDTVPGAALPETQAYVALLVLCFLVRSSQFSTAAALGGPVVEYLAQFNRRTLDLFMAKLYSTWSLAHERNKTLNTLRPALFLAHRTSCIRHDEIGQATLLNLLLRNFLHYHLYDQAAKLASKAKFPSESVSNNQLVRHLYYRGRIAAVQLDYSDAFAQLSQALRKAPANTGLGFRRSVLKFRIIVQLLMGDVPDRSTFLEKEHRAALVPYLKITQAVRAGSVGAFDKAITTCTATFKADDTLTLIHRLRHNVIKAGLRTIATCYSCIRFEDVAAKLRLESAEDAESLCAKAIRDGIIDAVLDHAAGCLSSKALVDVYATTEPQQAFHKRIAFCLEVHDDAVRAMVYPRNAFKKQGGGVEELNEEELDPDTLAALADDDDVL